MGSTLLSVISQSSTATCHRIVSAYQTNHTLGQMDTPRASELACDLRAQQSGLRLHAPEVVQSGAAVQLLFGGLNK